jgi:hypothetical protein
MSEATNAVTTSTPSPAKNGEDPIIRLLKQILAQQEATQLAIESLEERILELSNDYGDGFSLDN